MDKEKERMRELRLNINFAKKVIKLEETDYEYKLSLFGLIDVWDTEWKDIKRKRQYRANKKYNKSKIGKEKNRQRALKRWRETHDVKKPRVDVQPEVDKGLVIFQ